MNEPGPEQLRRRADRERRARLEAERLAEAATRDLYIALEDLRASTAAVELAHKNLELLQRAAVAANEAASLEEAAARVLADVTAATGWPIGHLYVTDEGGQRVVPTTVWHLDDPEGAAAFRRITEASPLGRGEGLPGRVLETREPAWIVDVTADPNFPRAAHAEDIGVRAGFGFPVLLHGEPVAVLEFFATEPADPDDGLLQAMAHIGTQLGRVVERTRAEAALRLSEAENRLIVETADDAFIAIDADSTILEWNRAAERIFGWTREEAIGRTLPETIIPAVHREAHIRGLSRYMTSGSGAVLNRRLELTACRKDKSELPVELTPWAIGHGEGVRFNAFVSDITERKEFERQLRHQALHDTLTGLPNRALLLDRMAHALSRCQREGCMTAVLFVDLDRFKAVNDTFGHDAGDRLLLAVAARLPMVIRPSDTVARLGGDEFVVVCEGLTDRHQAVDIAERLVSVMRAPIVIGGTEVVISASVGLAVTTGDADPEQLLGDADLAMYRAKERRNGVFEMFDESMRLRLAERVAIETALRVGVAAGQLTAVYQPIVSLADGHLVAVEALARWRHPERGMVPPSEFIPVAEETGLIGALGDFILEQACTQLLAWREEHGDRAPDAVTVNVSVRQIEQDDFVAGVHALLTRLRFPPERLLLEITESAVMHDETVMVDRLSALRDLGIRLAIDDFGTGYSSLGRLSVLPVDTLKIDRSLVAGLDTAPAGEALVSAAVAVAHSLGLRVVAEGIETVAQREALGALGCDAGQGFLLARPLPAADLSASLRSWPAASAG